MLTRTGASLQIDAIHARAICDEIGDRLRNILDRELSHELPPRLRDLMAQLAKADNTASPSIAPSLDEMMQPAPVALLRRAQDRSLQPDAAISNP
jgi:hypothetical protein